MKLKYYEKWKNQASSLADDYLGTGEPKEAYNLLRKVLWLHPEETNCRVKLASALLAAGDLENFRAEGLPLSFFPSREVAPQDRLELLHSVLSKFPNDVNLKLKTAEVAFLVGDLPTAESLLTSLADFYLNCGLPMKSIQFYLRILEMDSEKFHLLRTIAEIYAAQRIFDKAIPTFFELADKYIDRQMFREASETFLKILAIDPVNEKACSPLAKVYVLQNEIEKASNIMHKQIENHLNKGRFDQALELSNNFVEILLENNRTDQATREREQMAEALFARGRKEEAIGLFAGVAQIALAAKDVVKFTKLLTHEVQFHAERDDAGKMAETYQKMILPLFSLAKENAWSLVEELVRELSEREQIAILDQVLRAMSQRLDNEQHFEDAEKLLIRLGDFYAELYRTEEAIRIYETIVRRATGDPTPYLRLADLYAQDNNLPRAVDFYVKSMDLCVLANDPACAESIFQKAFAKNSKNPALLAKMGYVYYTIGEWNKALDFYGKAMSLDPGHRQAVVGMAMTYAKKGMLDEMVALAKQLITKGLIAEIVEEYRKALGLTCAPSECSMALGILYKDLGFMEEAIIEFQSASKDPKLFLEACHFLGLCFKAQGFSHLAIRQFQKALESPGHAEEEFLEIRYNLAVTYEEAQRTREAYELYSDILVSDIGYKDVKSRLRKLGNAKNKGKVIPLDRGTEGRKN